MNPAYGALQKKKKNFVKPIAAATLAGVKTLHFLRNAFLSCIENAAFMWGQDCCKKGTPVNSNVIQEKVVIT